MKQLILFTITIFVGSTTLGTIPSYSAENIVISAGPKGGSFYSLGNVLCKVINSSSQEINCSVLPMREGDATESFANLVNVRDGAVEFAITSSDWLHFAYQGKGPVKFILSKFDSLRGLFAVDIVPLTLIAKRDSGIQNLNQLKGKRINLGQPRTDSRKILDKLMRVLNWNKSDFEIAEEINESEQSFAFCFGRVQAISIVAKHPNPGIQKISRHCNAKFVPIPESNLDQLFKDAPYLSSTIIPGGLYGAGQKPVNTIGTSISFVSSTDISNELVSKVVKILFENFDKLQTFHPAIEHIDKSKMIRSGVTAPIHDGAREYFLTAGLL